MSTENSFEEHKDKALSQIAVSGSFIFSKYLEDKCPICDNHIDSDNFYSHTENGGKCMAKYFRCHNCNSEYTVGYNRNRQPINSEITLLGSIR